MRDPSRRSYVQAKLKELIERASSVADANLHRSRKPYPLGLAMRSNGSKFAFILDHTKERDQTIAQIKRLFLQHNVVPGPPVGQDKNVLRHAQSPLATSRAHTL
jgi:hypothetical protein